MRLVAFVSCLVAVCGCGLVLETDPRQSSSDAGSDSAIDPVDGRVDVSGPDAMPPPPDAGDAASGDVGTDTGSMGCVDGDGDGVCDPEDLCPGFDDALLGPEVCNGVDDDCDMVVDEGVNSMPLSYSGSEYLFCNSPGLSRQDAQIACNAWGGHLAILDSDEENWRVAEEARMYGEAFGRWIDLYDAAESPTPMGQNWIWSTTGAPASYVAWSATEPNNLTGDEHCVEMVPYIVPLMERGSWNDLRCAEMRAYVCERP